MGISEPRAFVAYSSPAGTTRHVAQVIEITLKDLGYKYGVTDLGKRDDHLNLNSKMKDLVTDYCLWIGTPVYAGHALPPVMSFIVCFVNPVLRTGSQKETLALSCFLCLTAFGRETKPPVSRVVVYF